MPRKSVPTPCVCNTKVEYMVTADDFPEMEGEERDNFVDYPVYGPCGATTKGGNFAPGHDAKLKGLLIRLNRQGADYNYLEGALLIGSDPMVHASQYGWGRFLTYQPKRRVRKARTTEGGEPQRSEFPKAVEVKIGRWTYKAQQLSDGRVIYQDKKGNTLEADPSKIV